MLFYLLLPVGRGFIVYSASYVAGRLFSFAIDGASVAFSEVGVAVCGFVYSLEDAQ